jgi:predicted nucleic acid-binding protein
MVKKILIDSGPLISFLSSSEHHHRWVLEQMSVLDGDLLTTESVLSEVVYLLKQNHIALKAIQDLIDQSLIRVIPTFSESPMLCFKMIMKYADLPASVADVSLVYLHSTTKYSVIFTLDSDFLIYKTTSGNPLNLIAPFT